MAVETAPKDEPAVSAAARCRITKTLPKSGDFSWLRRVRSDRVCRESYIASRHTHDTPTHEHSHPYSTIPLPCLGTPPPATLAASEREPRHRTPCPRLHVWSGESLVKAKVAFIQEMWTSLQFEARTAPVSHMGRASCGCGARDRTTELDAATVAPQIRSGTSNSDRL